MLLSVVKHKTYGDELISDRLAVNDVIISHGEYLGLADMRVDNCRGDHVCYRADALVLSTPQGSTAYSLLAGGPIISHSIDCITVTPVSPHSFFNRSIVYGPEETIRVTNIGQSTLKVSIDGRFAYEIEQGESCDIVKSIKKLKMITFEQSNLFSTLSKKIRHLQDLI
jgi:NAD+ kinase